MESKKTKAFKEQEKAKIKFTEDTVAFVTQEFLSRQNDRRNLERKWELNLNFLAGRQYCDVIGDEIKDDEKFFYWQKREIFNHIAPIVETRLAKFSRVNPILSVTPASDDDNEITNARLAEKVLQSAFKTCDLEKTVKEATNWCEVCGTAFYKVLWDDKLGRKLGEADGETVFEGDVKIIAVSPFEVFPDNLSTEDLEDCKSVIHARAMNVLDVKALYNKTLQGGNVEVFSPTFSEDGAFKTNNLDSVIVIEYYEKPSKEFENGRLITVADGELLFYGDLPFINGEYGRRTYPFIKQTSIKVAGSFYGTSVVERLIPVQRAYNAVKNRKHEFLNRLSMGIMTVEDGAIDVDDLSEEGLSPGKVIVYRQGSNPPTLMDDITMPSSFDDEEDKLINEFVVISGVSDVASNSHNAKVSSGSALELLIEQDNERLTVIAEDVRRCYAKIAKHVLRLYRQFLSDIRVVKEIDDNSKTKLFYVSKDVITSDEIVIENENELLYTPNQKKDIIFKLYDSGLLQDENGTLRAETKEKILTLLGYKNLDYDKGLTKLHEEKAKNEHSRLLIEEQAVEIIDDHKIHVDEHTRYILGEYENLSEEQKQRLLKHVEEHKNLI